MRKSGSISSYCQRVVYKLDPTKSFSGGVTFGLKEWSSLFSAIVEKHAPMREMRVLDRNSLWIKSEPKSMMISGDRLKKAAVNTNFQP